MMYFIFAVLIFIALIAIFIGVRGIYLIRCIYAEKCGFDLKGGQTLRTVCCVGSGGHTSELLKLLIHMDRKKYNPRLYIMADSDKTSEIKIENFENKSDYQITKIPRSRNVNQSFKSSIFSTLFATLITIPLIYRFKPNIIFCNGPGTCIPICIVAFVMRCLLIIDCRIIFVESVCRVKTLSLTGKILQYFADVLVVQWPQVHKACFRSKYYGRLT